MNFKEYKELIKKDLISYIKNENTNIKDYVFAYIKYPGFKYVFTMRTCKLFKNYKLLLPLYALSRINFRHLSFKYGIQIPYYIDVKGGFCINHYSCIVIDGASKIGENFDIRQGTTIGWSHNGAPIIGNNVYIGAGSTIIGDIIIGDNVIIGANSTITKNIPSNCTVVGCNNIIHNYNIIQ